MVAKLSNVFIFLDRSMAFCWWVWRSSQRDYIQNHMQQSHVPPRFSNDRVPACRFVTGEEHAGISHHFVPQLFTGCFYALIICLIFFNLPFSFLLGFWDCTTGTWCPIWIMLWGAVAFGHQTIFFSSIRGFNSMEVLVDNNPLLLCSMAYPPRIVPYLSFLYWLDLILNQVHCRWSLEASSESSCVLDIKVGKFRLGYGFLFSL